ncbi:hypothetical protein D5W64_12810 [Salmonella enterica subsp. enterica serovar Saintpaul]|nr:hypothetical protein [Salmonella enterica subsp. enterica serovar Saintpaul]
MNFFYPVAKPSTRQYFINPLISAPVLLENKLYVNREQTAYVKPGEVPNLLSLVQPEGVVFTANNKPIAKEICVTDIIFALWHEGEWVPAETLRSGRLYLSETEPGIWEINGTISVLTRRTYILNDRHGPLEDNATLLVPIHIKYIEQTCALSLSTTGSYDAGTIELLGIKLEVPVEGTLLRSDDDIHW